MPKKKDTAGKDEERQARVRPGPPSQARSEKNRRTGKGNTARSVPKLGKHDATRGDSSGDGLH
ncbi:MAG TPA: hypothetical protein VNZ44_14285 [Pyrinomonadaceae bacterium]|nr:hypothetical protein [Pyrinomonadaceae bacterium]